MADFKWTEPFFGVTHIDIPRRRSGIQFTAQDYGTFAIADVIRWWEGAERESHTFSTLQEAKTWLEQRASEIGVMGTGELVQR